MKEKKDETKHDCTEEKVHTPANIDQFVCTMLERLQDMLGSLGTGKNSEELDMPKAIGPETEQALSEAGESSPVMKIRKFVIIPKEQGDEVKGLMRKLTAAKEKDLDAGLREVFAAVKHARGSAEHQWYAVARLEELAKECTDQQRQALDAVKRDVLAGTEESFDTASFRLRNVFASRVPESNVRLAYTSLSTQFGEGYQLCPKAAHQIGRALPMELSKCRDNCIDSRVTREGVVTCAYADWLRKAADNYKASEDRIERVKHNLNGQTLNDLGMPDPVKSYEGQLNDKRDAYPKAPKESLEATFESSNTTNGHKGETLKRIQDLAVDLTRSPKETREEALDDARTGEEHDEETLEQMLESGHDPLNEQELDMLIEELLEDSRLED
ncbi:MAG: hypothetical protein JSS66_05160 [Armatimonadetes bacterium]|nr:hypothetical protein [Armatimonadota bacterium]